MNRVCVHCGTRKVCRPRGLCWRCFYKPGVRYQYGSSTAPTVRRGSGLTPPKKMPTPTTARPGTPEKEAVLTERAANGQHLWHPLDSRG